MEKESQHYKVEDKHALYFSLFRGARVLQSALEAESPYMKPTIDALVNSGLLHAQEIFTEEGGIDTMLFIPQHERPEE